MAEKRITVLVDYPTRKERTTTYKEKVFYEREYLRKVTLLKANQLRPLQSSPVQWGMDLIS